MKRPQSTWPSPHSRGTCQPIPRLITPCSYRPSGRTSRSLPCAWKIRSPNSCTARSTSIICHTRCDGSRLRPKLLVGDRREHLAPDRGRVGEVVAARPLVVGEDHRAVLDRDPHAALAGVARRAAATPRGSRRGCRAGSSTGRGRRTSRPCRRRASAAASITLRRCVVRGLARLGVGRQRVRVVGERGDRQAAAREAVDDLGRLRVVERVDVDVADARVAARRALAGRPAGDLERLEAVGRRPVGDLVEASASGTRP